MIRKLMTAAHQRVQQHKPHVVTGRTAHNLQGRLLKAMAAERIMRLMRGRPPAGGSSSDRSGWW